MYQALIETRHASSTRYRSVELVRQDVNNAAQAWNFSSDPFAGAIELPGDGGSAHDRLLCWQVQNTGDCSLQLAEVSLAGGIVGEAVHVTIPGQVFPSVAHAIIQGRLCMYLLLSDHAVAVLQLPLPDGGRAPTAPGQAAAQQQQQQTQQPGRRGGSMLDVLRSGQLYMVDLQSQLAPVGAPTAMTVTGGHLCIAGSTDVCACVPLDQHGGLSSAQVTPLSQHAQLAACRSACTPRCRLSRRAAAVREAAGRCSLWRSQLPLHPTAPPPPLSVNCTAVAPPPRVELAAAPPGRQLLHANKPPGMRGRHDDQAGRRPTAPGAARRLQVSRPRHPRPCSTRHAPASMQLASWQQPTPSA